MEKRSVCVYIQTHCLKNVSEYLKNIHISTIFICVEEYVDFSISILIKQMCT